jgi:hypothetical protein
MAAPSDTNFGSKGATSKYMFLVPLFDLKFLHEFAAGAVGTSNRRHEPPTEVIDLDDAKPFDGGLASRNS